MKSTEALNFSFFCEGMRFLRDITKFKPKQQKYPIDIGKGSILPGTKRCEIVWGAMGA